MKTHVKTTPEMLDRAAKWLEEPLPIDEEASEQTMREVLAIVGHQPRSRLALADEVEAAE